MKNTLLEHCEKTLTAKHKKTTTTTKMFLNSDARFRANRASTFDSLEAATRARENLNGADIYSGCCTLKIDYAKVSGVGPPPSPADRHAECC